MDFIKRAWVEISIENLKYNFFKIKTLLKNVKVMAVLKANGYNCGDVRIAHELAALISKFNLQYQMGRGNSFKEWRN